MSNPTYFTYIGNPDAKLSVPIYMSGLCLTHLTIMGCIPTKRLPWLGFEFSQNSQYIPLITPFI